MSAVQGQQVAEEVCKTLCRDTSEAAFDLFWTRLLKRKSEVDAVAEPQLPRKRRAPARQEVGDSGTHYFPSTPKEYFHHMYYAAVDVTTECIRIYSTECIFLPQTPLAARASGAGVPPLLLPLLRHCVRLVVCSVIPIILKERPKKAFKRSLKATLLDILQTEDSYIDVDTIFVEMKK